jgi:mono/diheme cytochrome c family protein
MQSILKIGLAIFSMAVVVASPTVAQTGVTDPSQGRELANSLCSTCHDVGPGPAETAKTDIPSFFAIANRPDQSAQHLATAIILPHPEMPKVSFTTREMRDIIAYIMSLRAKQ